MPKLAVVVGCTLLFIVWRSSQDLTLNAEGPGDPARGRNGDVNGDLKIDLADPVYLIDWLLGTGPAPVACAQGDDDDDGDNEAKVFSNRDLRGPYAFSFDGLVTVTSADGSLLTIPVAAVGRFVVDGEGGTPEEAVRTLNLGGFVVLEQTATGTYQVNTDGTGTLEAIVTTVNVIGTPPPGVALPPTTLETFSFVLDRKNDAHFIGTAVLDPETHTPLLAPAIHGEARKQ